MKKIKKNRYFCIVELRKKILSHFLLAIYLMVVAHQSISHTHASGLDGDAAPNHSHKHENFKDIHHEHHFHVGIFHFLGHLFESISHVSDNADDHLVVIQNNSIKKASGYRTSICKYFLESNLVVLEVDAESLPDPPYYQIPYLQKLTRSTSPLRAPPSHV